MATESMAFPSTIAATAGTAQPAEWPLPARVDRDTAYLFAKRALDLVVAVVLLVSLLPLFALIAIAICLDSGWPIFYRGTRIGRFGRPFTVLKFRSMRADADPAAHAAYLRDLI